MYFWCPFPVMMIPNWLGNRLQAVRPARSHWLAGYLEPKATCPTLNGNNGVRVACYNPLYTAVNGKVGWVWICHACMCLTIMIRHMKCVPLFLAASVPDVVEDDVDQLRFGSWHQLGRLEYGIWLQNVRLSSNRSQRPSLQTVATWNTVPSS